MNRKIKARRQNYEKIIKKLNRYGLTLFQLINLEKLLKRLQMWALFIHKNLHCYESYFIEITRRIDVDTAFFGCLFRFTKMLCTICYIMRNVVLRKTATHFSKHVSKLALGESCVSSNSMQINIKLELMLVVFWVFKYFTFLWIVQLQSTVCTSNMRCVAQQAFLLQLVSGS